ncbi:MAG: protoglobin domain-containing protein [Planctomycetota bacterium]|nr:protoglobin domain-containing protein [Planctomycetota bacterium]
MRGIRAIRRSLGFTDRHQELIRAAHPRIAQDLQTWVDNFYARLLSDPVSAALISDEGRVIRLKRSLFAWFDEVFTLPFDDDYERARANIGQTHVRIGMPPYLMVTAMSGIRRDALKSIRAAYADEQETARQTAHAISMLFDLELALMLDTYRRQERKLMRQKERAIYAERAVRRLADSQRDQLDAALCYVELAGSEDPDARRRYLVKLRDLLLELGRTGQPLRTPGLFAVAPPREASLYAMVTLARDRIGHEPQMKVRVQVEPEDLTLRIHEEAVQLAIEELLQNAVTHGAGGDVHMDVRPLETDLVELRVRDSGPGWDAHIQSLRDVYARGIGLGLSFCELVADLHQGKVDLFQPEGGGAGVVMTLRALTAEGDA